MTTNPLKAFLSLIVGAAIVTPTATVALLRHTAPERELAEVNEYPAVSLGVIAAGKWTRPRAEITGTVTLVRHEADGDWHFRVSDGKVWVVCEIIPEMPLAPPALGERVTARGIVRWDADPGHHWAELHPVVAWRKD